MKIAFVGDEKCNGENMLAIALTMHYKYKKSILLIDADFLSDRLEIAFYGDDKCFIKEEAYYGIREGMDYLLYRIGTGGYSSANTREGVTYLNSKLAYVKAAIKGNVKEYEKHMKMYVKTLLAELEKEFDYVMIKRSGVFDSITREIIKNCDGVIINYSDEEIEAAKDKLYIVSKKRLFFLLLGQVVGDFDVQKDDLVRYCRVEVDKLGFIPYNPSFESRINNGKIMELFEPCNNKKTGLKFKEFIFNVELATHKINKWLEEI